MEAVKYNSFVKNSVGFSGHLSSFYHGLMKGVVVFFLATTQRRYTERSHSVSATSNRSGIAALEVFVGGACYGANATVYKLAYAGGFTWPQVIGAQMWFAAAFFGIALIILRFRGKKLVMLDRKSFLKLIGLGAISCATAIFYCFAMSRLPVAVALTLLFQFTWIGLVIQIIITRRPPKPQEVIAAVIILLGTVLASNVYKSGFSNLDPLAIACALLAAVSCALFVTMSGRVMPPCSSAQRGFLVCIGSCVASLLVCPDFLVSGVVFDGIAPYGVIIGFFGMLCPVLLFGLGSPHLPAGISTVLASAELPAGLFCSALVLGDVISPVQWIGVVAILGGVAISQLKVREVKVNVTQGCECDAGRG